MVGAAVVSLDSGGGVEDVTRQRQAGAADIGRKCQAGLTESGAPRHDKPST